jgi:hypothetical protein
MISECIECEDGLKCLPDDSLVSLTEEELDKYLNCDESIFELNQVERQSSHPQ